MVGKAYKRVVADVVCLDGAEGSSRSHSPLTVAVWAYGSRPDLCRALCPASMEIRPLDVQVVRVVHSFYRVLLEVTHPRLGQVRVFLLKEWTWDKLIIKGYDARRIF